MRDDDFETSIKIVIVGNGIVGKSSMIQRYCNGVFSNDYKKTIGVDFLERIIRVDGTELRLMLWDTAGQEEFDALTKAYYRGAQGCVLAFSTTDKDSFDAIDRWKKKVEYECGNIPMALVQNKIDLLNESKITPDQVDKLAKKLNLPLFLTSARKNVNIDEVFYFLAKSYLDSLEESVDDDEDGDMHLMVSPNEKAQSSSFFKFSSHKNHSTSSTSRHHHRHHSHNHHHHFVKKSKKKSGLFSGSSSSSRGDSHCQPFMSPTNRHFFPPGHLPTHPPHLHPPYKRRFALIPTRSPGTIVLHHPPPVQTSTRHHPAYLAQPHHHLQRLHPLHHPHPSLSHINYLHHRKEEFRKKNSLFNCWIL